MNFYLGTVPYLRKVPNVLGAALALASPVYAQSDLTAVPKPHLLKPRVIVLSDIGNEPDDQMSLVRLLLYANEIDIQGLIATTSTWQRTKLRPEIMKSVIAAYGKVRENLMLHARGWPTEAGLYGVVTSGQPYYGMEGVNSGAYSDGAKAIIAAADKDDPRPLWISIWGGANTLAQALGDVRATRTDAELAKFVAKLRVTSISDQDDAGPWIRSQFPGLFYIVKPSSPDSGDYASATWTGISGDAYYRNGEGADASLVTNAWLDRNIRSKGPLGAAYPRYAFIMEGDTPAFLGLIPNGLNAPETPNYGGWGGRYIWRQPYGETRPIWTQGGDLFRRVTSADTVNGHTSDQATIWRWRAAYQNDFAARMDWTVKDFEHANHPPRIAIAGFVSGNIIRTPLKEGQAVSFDASASSDPDGNRLSFKWFGCGEAGAREGVSLSDIALSRTNKPSVTITATLRCRKAWIDGIIPCKGNGTAHIVLAVTDNGKPALTRYQRIILTVEPK
jgi:Protein of unknown function (DUF1593)